MNVIIDNQTLRQPKPSVFAVITDKQNRILLVRKNYNKHDWTCPGGFMEPGETPEEACRREVTEESACAIEDVQFRHVYAVPSRSDVILVFRAQLSVEQEWQPNEEIAEKSFFALDQLPQPMTRETIKKIHDALDISNQGKIFTLQSEDLQIF